MMNRVNILGSSALELSNPWRGEPVEGFRVEAARRGQSARVGGGDLRVEPTPLGCYFKAHMKFPLDYFIYPYSPPSVSFLRKILHLGI
jgi:hypothetical protein